MTTSSESDRSDSELRAGDEASPAQRRVVGGYRLKRLLGRGGMAEVWLGRHEVSKGLAAVKLLRPDAAETLQSLFRREQRAALRLRHPNVVPIFDVGDDYIAAAYVEGIDLRHRMRTPLAPAEAVAIARAIGSALSTAHEQGVIHCDVKPANILLDRSGTPFLTDFGIARIVNEPKYDGEKAEAGTPAYMAPEQRHEREPSPAWDQYALARTLLALLLGRSPPRDSARALALLSDELERALGATLAKALAPAPGERFGSLRDFVDALRAIDVAEQRPPDLLVELKRDDAAFAWATRPRRTERYGESIVRADYALSELEAAGCLDPAALATFRERTGYADLAWSLYARDERLGPLTAPAALARAQEAVVLLHGLFTSRRMWVDVAVGLARDNGLAVALTPDLLGFGESSFAPDASVRACSPERSVTGAMAWLELLGLGQVPTILLGHSISASALLCVRADELPPNVHRICLTPALPSGTGATRARAFAQRLTARVASRVPRSIARRMASFAFHREPSLQRISVAAREEMAASAVRLGASRVANLMLWLETAKLAPAHELGECTVVTTPDDPLVPYELVERTLDGARIPEERHYQLVYGGHFPHLIDDHHPEWGARNVHELVSVIDAVLDSTLAKRTRRGASSKRTPSAGSDGTTVEGASVDVDVEGQTEAAETVQEPRSG